MTFPALFRNATSFSPPRRTCRRQSPMRQTTSEPDQWLAPSPLEVIERAIDLLDPARTTRLTELLHAPVIVQVPRYRCADQSSVEELCLILPPPGLPFESVFALAVASDYTLLLGRFGLPAVSLDAVRAQADSMRETEVDGLQVLMQAHSRRVFASLSACADVALIPGGVEPSPQQCSISTLDTMLSQAWVRAGDAWFDSLVEAEVSAIDRHGLRAERLRVALAGQMRARLAGALDYLDYFDAGVVNDPILSGWHQFLASSVNSDFVPSLSAYNYLVSRDPVVKASRVPVWDDPAFMTNVENFARYQRASEVRLARSQGRR